jgi:hypothetical protein
VFRHRRAAFRFLVAGLQSNTSGNALIKLDEFFQHFGNKLIGFLLAQRKPEDDVDHKQAGKGCPYGKFDAFP